MEIDRPTEAAAIQRKAKVRTQLNPPCSLFSLSANIPPFESTLTVNWRQLDETSSSRRNRGFTLIEVLLVLVILVILASLAVVNILSAQKSAHVKAAKVQVELFDGLLQHTNWTSETIPSTASGLQALRTRRPISRIRTSGQGPYIDKGYPLGPLEQPYQYVTPASTTPTGSTCGP